jgi:hypothetical protein
MMLAKNVLYYGQAEALAEVIPLRAGPLTMLYEGGDLRYIKMGETEIVRRLYVAVRDHVWGTVLPNLSNIHLDIGPDSFRLSFDVENKAGEIDFFWRGVINGDSQGTITYTMQGQTRSTFRRNRIGFCVLHPMTCAGVPSKIEHVDGSVDHSPFPQLIAPQLIKDGHLCPVAPFENMQAVAHQVGPELWAEVRFTGEVFEMEDQRNWSDASYKTYGTPLSRPWPVEVEAGTEISQSVTISLSGEIPPATIDTGPKALTVTVGSRAGQAMPQLGLGQASHGQPLQAREIERLKALKLSHLRVDLPLAEPGYKAKLGQTSAEARALAVSLEIALFLSQAAEQELADLTSLLQELKPPVQRWLIFHRDEKTTAASWVKLARQHLAGYDASAQIGAGTNIYFTELNAVRPPVEVLDVVAYSLNPQAHAFDNASLVETLEAQAVTVASARLIAGDRPLIVSPITLLARFNPNATGPEPAPAPGQLPAQVDVRQMSLFGAGWTLGSLKYILASPLQSATYYETSGWRGVMEIEAGSPLPEKFQSIPGAVFPLYHVLADVGEFAGGEVIPTTSSHTLAVEGLALRQAGRTRLLVANLTAQAQQVSLKKLAGQVRLWYLDETNVVEAMQSPEAFRARPGQAQATTGGNLTLNLRPYAIAKIDYGP